jgi:6-phosphogluconolactonase
VYGELAAVDNVPEAFVGEVVRAWQQRPRHFFSLVVSGGDLARRCYEHLAAVARELIDWSMVDLYWGDERLVPRRHPDSNELLVRQALVNRLPPIRGVFPMRVEDTAEAYDALVLQAAPFDVVHLGLGPDGHTASLFPGSDALDAPIDRYVVDTVDPSGTNFHPRRTLTFSGIAMGNAVLVTVDGKEKAEAVRRVRDDDPTAPGSRVRAPRVKWLIGESAL